MTCLAKSEDLFQTQSRRLFIRLYNVHLVFLSAHTPVLLILRLQTYTTKLTKVQPRCLLDHYPYPDFD